MMSNSKFWEKNANLDSAMSEYFKSQAEEGIRSGSACPALRDICVQLEVIMPNSLDEYLRQNMMASLPAKAPGIDAKEKGLREDKDGVYYDGEKALNFTYSIERVLWEIDDDADDTSDDRINGGRYDVRVKLWRNGVHQVHRLEGMSESDLSRPELLKKIPFATSPLGSAKLGDVLFHYYNYLLDRYNGEVGVAFSAPGWWGIHGQQVYVDSEKALGYPTVEAQADTKLRIENDESVHNLFGHFTEMCCTVMSKGFMAVMLLYVLTSFVFTLFSNAGYVPSHLLAIIGPRGCRKTSLALCFTQLIPEDKRRPKCNFLATQAGIQSLFGQFKDACLLVDDLSPTTDRKRRGDSETTLEMLLRLFGDGSERVIHTDRDHKKSDKTDYAVKGGCVVTGEYFKPAGSESSYARAVVLDLGADSVNLDQLDFFQRHPEILETLVYRFLEFVTFHWDDCIGLIQTMVDSYRKKCRGTFSNGRYADYFGQYMATACILERMFREEDSISEEEGKRFLNEMADAVLSVLLANDRSNYKRTPIYNLLESLNYAIEANDFVRWGEPLPDKAACLVLGEDAVFVRQKDLPDFVRQYCKKTGEPYVGRSKNELGKILVDAGICSRKNEGKDSTRLGRRYNAVYDNTRLIKIPFSVLEGR